MIYQSLSNYLYWHQEKEILSCFFLLLHTLEKIKQILLEENLRLLRLFVFSECQLASTEAQWGKQPHLHNLVTARWW